MPRNVRPSFVSLSVDGLKTIATGPRARNGQMSAIFGARSGGSVLPLLDVEFRPDPDGQYVAVRIRDIRTGATIFDERFAQ